MTAIFFFLSSFGVVMPGPGPGIHDVPPPSVVGVGTGVDGRIKSGHDKGVRTTGRSQAER